MAPIKALIRVTTAGRSSGTAAQGWQRLAGAYGKPGIDQHLVKRPEVAGGLEHVGGTGAGRDEPPKTPATGMEQPARQAAAYLVDAAERPERQLENAERLSRAHDLGHHRDAVAGDDAAVGEAEQGEIGVIAVVRRPFEQALRAAALPAALPRPAPACAGSS